MIIVMGHMKFAAGEGARVAPLLAAHAAEVMKEEGCELYAFAFDAADPDLVRISERWATPEALAAHGQAPHQKAFGRSLRDYKMEGIKVDAWNGEFWRNLIGRVTLQPCPCGERDRFASAKRGEGRRG